MILAGAAVLSYIDDPLARSASESIYGAALDTVAAGIATADLGGSATTTEFTDAVISRMSARASQCQREPPNVSASIPMSS